MNGCWKMDLVAGERYRLEAIFRKTEGFGHFFSLKWQRRNKDPEVVPNSAFGLVE